MKLHKGRTPNSASQKFTIYALREIGSMMRLFIQIQGISRQKNAMDENADMHDTKTSSQKLTIACRTKKLQKTIYLHKSKRQAHKFPLSN